MATPKVKPDEGGAISGEGWRLAGTVCANKQERSDQRVCDLQGPFQNPTRMTASSRAGTGPNSPARRRTGKPAGPTGASNPVRTNGQGEPEGARDQLRNRQQALRDETCAGQGGVLPVTATPEGPTLASDFALTRRSCHGTVRRGAAPPDDLAEATTTVAGNGSAARGMRALGEAMDQRPAGVRPGRGHSPRATAVHENSGSSGP